MKNPPSAMGSARSILSSTTALVLALPAAFLAPSVCAQREISNSYYFTTLAGSGRPGVTDGAGSAASFSFPAMLTLDEGGNVYVADGYNQTIRKITPDGIVTTLAGKAGEAGGNDGTTTTARFHGPVGVAFDRSGNLIVTEAFNGNVRKITPTGEVSTIARGFMWPWGVTVDDTGNIFVVDLGLHTLSKIAPSGLVTTVPGTSFHQPTGVILDRAGNLLVSDSKYGAIRKVTPSGAVTTFASLPGSADGKSSSNPGGLAMDPNGNLFVADFGTAVIFKISPAGVVTTIAGLAGKAGNKNGTGDQARFDFPIGIAIDARGSLYVADSENNIIRRTVPPPGVALFPASQIVGPGANVQLAANVTSEFPVRYQWSVGGTDIPGATEPALALDRVQVMNTGNYSVIVSSDAGSVISDAATLAVTSAELTSRLSNISVRTSLTPGEVVTVGIAIDGGTRDVLVRAVGPALIPLGVSQAIADPRLELFNGTALVLANDDWPSVLAPTFVSVGAFELPVGGRDAAFRRDLSGTHSIQARGNGSGVVLVEAYAVGEVGTSRLINISARNRVGAGDSVLIAGFNVTGTGAKQVLIRAVGPGLSRFDVSERLSDPKLELYDSAGSRLSENDNWPASLATLFSQVGAFELTAGSRDAALLTALMPGSYSVLVKGVESAMGQALVEVFEVR